MAFPLSPAAQHQAAKMGLVLHQLLESKVGRTLLAGVKDPTKARMVIEQVLTTLQTMGLASSAVVDPKFRAAVIAAVMRNGGSTTAALEVLARMSVDEALKLLEMDSSELGDKTKLKNAYRKASMKHHPDRGGSNEEMQRVNEAHDLLEKAKPGSSMQDRKAKEAEEAKQNAEYLQSIKASLNKSFDESKFTQHLEQAVAQKLKASVQRKEEASRYGSSSYWIKAEWRTDDGGTVFYLQLYASTRHVQHVKQLGGGGEPDLHFTVSVDVQVIHANKKSKMKRRDWDWTSKRARIFDPEAVFPSAKIKKMLAGKEKGRQFAKRDMLTGLERYLKAHTWTSGKDWIANIPLGKDDQFIIQMRRSVFMRQAVWNAANLYKGTPGYRDTEKFALKYISMPEHEVTLKTLVDLKKQSKGIDDGKRLAGLINRAMEAVKQAWQSGKLDASVETPMNTKQKVIAAMLRAGRTDLANAVAQNKIVTARKSHFEPSQWVEQYEDAVGTLARNNYGAWKNVSEAEEKVKKAIKAYANAQRDDVLESFSGKNDIKYMVETYMYLDDPDPYGLEPPDPKIQGAVEKALAKAIGRDWKKFAGVRTAKKHGMLRQAGDDPKAWIVWAEGVPPNMDQEVTKAGGYLVDVLRVPVLKAVQALGYKSARVEPYDNVTLVINPAGR